MIAKSPRGGKPGGKDLTVDRLGDFFLVQFQFMGRFSIVIVFRSIKFVIIGPFSSHISRGYPRSGNHSPFRPVSDPLAEKLLLIQSLKNTSQAILRPNFPVDNVPDV